MVEQGLSLPRSSPCHRTLGVALQGQKSSQGLPRCNWDVNGIKGQPFHLLIHTEDSFFFLQTPWSPIFKIT